MRLLGLVLLITVILISFRFTLSEMGKNSAPSEDGVTEYTPKGLRTVTRKIASNSSPSSATIKTDRNERYPLERTRDEKTFEDYSAAQGPNPDVSAVASAERDGSEDVEPAPGRRRKKKLRFDFPGPDTLASPMKDDMAPSPGVITGTAGTNPTRAPGAIAPPPAEPTTGTVSRTRLECASNIGAGTYNSPVSLTLSCSASATISYCIAEGTCCSPSTGETYSAPFSVGASASTYCVSFSGADAFGNTSDVLQQYYTFSATASDIQVAHRKLSYQTTQLEGSLSLGSNDFGDPSIEGGVLNFKGTDPVVAGFTTCAEQVEDSAPLTPLTIMPQTSLSHLSSSMQLDVFFSDLKLVYGDNYITSYLQNSSFGPVYSCNTTKIRLEDFPYFETNPAATVTTGSVHEFFGGFTPVSFFEAPAPSISRSPAGTAMKNEGGQELRSGLFGIFY